ncbi:MAG: helix-turn-helix domain-containing protein [Enterococcus sp.]
MTFEKIQQIYPTAHFSNTPIDDPNFYCIRLEEGFAILRTSMLTNNERSLLQLLENPVKEPKNAATHRWYRILFKADKAPNTNQVRILQIKINGGKDFEKETWQQAIIEIVQATADAFWLSQDTFILIENKEIGNFSPSELFSIFQALDSDFNCYSQVFIGSFHQADDELSQDFQAERQIFLQQAHRSNSQQNFTLPNSAIDYLIFEPMQSTPLFKNLFELWFSDSEMTAILEALWQAQGNVSSAAKTMFLHRNTISYRIDKFQEATGLDLKKMDDLMFCHLLITCFSET